MTTRAIDFIFFVSFFVLVLLILGLVLMLRRLVRSAGTRRAIFRIVLLDGVELGDERRLVELEHLRRDVELPIEKGEQVDF